jgi:hypothetical protein
LNKKKTANLDKVAEMWNLLRGKKGAEENKNIPGGNKDTNATTNTTNIENEIVNPPDYNKNDAKVLVENEDDEILKALAEAKEIKKKIITETIHFAGQKYTYKKEADDKDIKKIKEIERKKTHKGLDSIIESISNKKNVSTIDKSKRDWQSFVQDKNLEKELNMNRKDGFLKKKQFIDETNANIYTMNKSTIKRGRTDNNFHK